MQATSVQHLEMNTGIWISEKKQKQSQVVVASSWLVAHTDTLGAHTVHWNKCSPFVFRAPLLQMAVIINILHMNMVRTTSWAPFHLTSAQLNQPRFLSLSSYLPHSSPQTFCHLLWYFRLASHKCEAPVTISCFWNVRVASKRKTISLFQTISDHLISARMWWHLAGLLLCCFYTAQHLPPHPHCLPSKCYIHGVTNLSNVKAVYSAKRVISTSKSIYYIFWKYVWLKTCFLYF